MPKILEDYIQSLPSALTNNAREITRGDFRRILKLNPVTASHILERKYGIVLDPDISLTDYIDESVESSYEEMEGMSTEELANVEI